MDAPGHAITHNGIARVLSTKQLLGENNPARQLGIVLTLFINGIKSREIETINAPQSHGSIYNDTLPAHPTLTTTTFGSPRPSQKNSKKNSTRLFSASDSSNL
jgi:hypothetical protein